MFAIQKEYENSRGYVCLSFKGDIKIQWGMFALQKGIVN